MAAGVATSSLCLLMAVATAAQHCCQYPPRTCYSVDSRFDSIDGRTKDFCAELYVPQTSDGAAVSHVDVLVVFAHGFTISNRAYEYIANELISNKFAVALPQNINDNFGHDMAAALAVTATLLSPRLQPHSATTVGKVVVGGHSIGGGAATLAMGQNIHLFDAYFSLALADTTPAIVPLVGPFLRCDKCVSAKSAAEKITKPALVIAGSKDAVADPKANAFPMYEAMRGASPRTSRCKVLEKATHCRFCGPGCFFSCKVTERIARGPFDFDLMPQNTQQDEVQALLVPFLKDVGAGMLSRLTSYLYRTTPEPEECEVK